MLDRLGWVVRECDRKTLHAIGQNDRAGQGDRTVLYGHGHLQALAWLGPGDGVDKTAVRGNVENADVPVFRRTLPRTPERSVRASILPTFVRLCAPPYVFGPEPHTPALDRD